MTQIKEVFPGDEVAEEEEYMAAEGTFAENGKVYASTIGILDLDDDECVAKVISPNPPNTLKIGDVIYAQVGEIRKTMAVAEALCKETCTRAIASDTNGTLHVSKISPNYTDDVAKELRKGDLIRARVIGVDPSLQLTTKDDHLGVVRSRCGICKTELIRKGDGLFCTECNRRTPRKLADDYGNIQI